jgi:hypothetical protein
MKIQDFLDKKEIEQLIVTLRESSLFNALDSGSRRQWLVAAGIDIPVDTNGDDTKFFSNLYGSLVAQDLSLGGAKRLGIVILLEHMVVYDVAITKRLDPENAEFLRGVIKKYETCHANTPQIHRQVEARAALAAARSRRSSVPTPNRTYRFDTDLILNSDLKKQIGEFTNILQIDGIFPFTLGGRFEVLDKYIVKRIEQTLRNKDDRPIKRVDVNLYAKNSSETFTGHQIIEQQIKDYYHCDRLADLFDERQRIDVLLVVWNYDVPPPEVQLIAESFWSVSQPQLIATVTGQSRRFIVLWINIDSEPLSLPVFYALPPLECFEVEEIVGYFRDRLLKFNVEADDVEYFLTQLKRHQGQLLGTFQEMNRLVEIFTGGRAA